MRKVRFPSANVLSGLAFGLSIVGTIVSVRSCVQSERTAETAGALEFRQIFNEALDLLGAQSLDGSESLNVTSNIPARAEELSQSEKARLEQLRRRIERLEIIDPKAIEPKALRFLYFAAFGNAIGVEKTLKELDGFRFGIENQEFLPFIATILIRTGHLEEGRKLYDKFLERRPNDSQALAMYATQLHMVGINEDSASLFRRAIIAEPTNPLSINGLAHVLAASGHSPEALQLLQNTIASGIGSAELYNTIGVLQHEANLFEEALASFEKAINISPTAALPHLNISLTQRAAGRSNAADAAMRKFQELKQPDMDAPADGHPIQTIGGLR